MNRARTTTKLLTRRMTATLVLGTSALLVAPAQSFASALVRFVHAVPSAGTVTVDVSQGAQPESVGRIGFGGVTAWHELRSGAMNWSLVSGARSLAHGTTTLGSGAYDLVLMSRSAAGVTLGVFRAEAGRAGTALVRVIHAAASLGSPQLRVDSKLVDPKLTYTQATPYLALAPGAHTMSANPAGASTPIISAHVSLAAGDAYSFVVVGSDGQRVRVVPLVDRGLAINRVQPQAPASSPNRGSFTVQSGDSLWTIAHSRLGHNASNEAVYREYVAIWKLNSARIGTGDPSLIFPGQRLTLPAA